MDALPLISETSARTRKECGDSLRLVSCGRKCTELKEIYQVSSSLRREAEEEAVLVASQSVETLSSSQMIW